MSQRALTILAFALAAARLFADGAWPMLRHTNYVALLGKPGQPLSFSVSCAPHGSYADVLQYALIDQRSREVRAGRLAVGESAEVSLPNAAPGLYVVELKSGWNLASFAAPGLPHAFVVRKELPLQTVGPCERLYFWAPKAIESFSVFVSASVTGEGLKLCVIDPNGNTVKETDGDCDRETRVQVAVPQQHRGAAWSLAILRPETKGLVLDDVMLHLSPEIAPFLAKRPEWAKTFAAYEGE